MRRKAEEAWVVAEAAERETQAAAERPRAAKTEAAAAEEALRALRGGGVPARLRPPAGPRANAQR